MEWLSNPDIWIAFFTLCALEIVLGIDNIIFISILTNRLPHWAFVFHFLADATHCAYFFGRQY